MGASLGTTADLVKSARDDMEATIRAGRFGVDVYSIDVPPAVVSRRLGELLP
jgi:hypothetical protein